MDVQFQDRADAGRKLAGRLGPIDPEHTVIYALPRGGVPVAREIAGKTGAPLDLLLVRKIGAPGHEELAVGAIMDGETPEVVVNSLVARQFGLDDDDVRARGAAGLKEIERRRELYLGGRAPLPVENRTAIVVDDGIATGATMKVALTALAKRNPARIILAVPVAPASAIAEMRDVADEVVCLATPTPFYAVGAHYIHFDQTSDAEVIEALANLNVDTA